MRFAEFCAASLMTRRDMMRKVAVISRDCHCSSDLITRYPNGIIQRLINVSPFRETAFGIHNFISSFNLVYISARSIRLVLGGQRQWSHTYRPLPKVYPPWSRAGWPKRLENTNNLIAGFPVYFFEDDLFLVRSGRRVQGKRLLHM